MTSGNELRMKNLIRMLELTKGMAKSIQKIG